MRGNDSNQTVQTTRQHGGSLPLCNLAYRDAEEQYQSNKVDRQRWFVLKVVFHSVGAIISHVRNVHLQLG